MDKMKICVIIVTRNRREDVRQTVTAYKNQTYENKEIIVIDNESTDGTLEMMRDEFPEIKYQWLPMNVDVRAIAFGLMMTDAEVIWRTDSDSHPESTDCFAKVAEILQNHPEIHIIASEDIEIRRGGMIWEWYPKKVDKTNIPNGGYISHTFHGTGAAIRKEVFDKIGNFWGFGYEEMDFSSRAIIAGFTIRYYPNIRTLHYGSLGDRDTSYRWTIFITQIMRYNWRYFPLPNAIIRTFLIFFYEIFIAVLSRRSSSALLIGISSVFPTIIKTIKYERTPVPRKMLKDITLGQSLIGSQLNYFKHLFISLWKKHQKK